ncbi:molybdopterin cofactor-binding domain-containing protein [Rhodovulum sp. DZ06]|uniref:xanthine dehydrogenase family protein molybdopterin-binding subunit n=1 Tax=Rhodovulum sp. DZ06 TaxID=3425126 RepID=UPI003D3503BE
MFDRLPKPARTARTDAAPGAPRVTTGDAPALAPGLRDEIARAKGPVNLSRRGFLGAAAGLTLAVALTPKFARAEAAEITPGTRVPAFLTIREDGSILLNSPFVEGGQGVATGIAQIVAEELDADIEAFEVVCAPPGRDYQVMGGMRITGGSSSVRSSFMTMRRLGAAARAMLIEAAATRLDVPAGELTTEPGAVLHAASGRRIAYAELAEAAMALDVPAEPPLKQGDFRYIGKSVPRMDVRDKSTGKAKYAIDLSVPDMLLAAVQHAPRLGMEPASIANRAELEAMRGVHSVHLLPGAVAVVADRWWRARAAADAAEVEWTEGEGARFPLPADFSTDGLRETLHAATGDGAVFEEKGDAAAALEGAAQVVEARYDAPFLAHGQLEPPSAIARFNDDGTLEIWLPNQAPEMHQAEAAKLAGLEPGQVMIHSPQLGGFFGRHFFYENSTGPFPQAVRLAKAVGRPVKVLWSREEEFLRDALRPMGHARFRAGLDEDGMPVALMAETVGEGPTGRWYGAPPGKDLSAVEGVSGKSYAIPNTRVAQIHEKNPAMIGYWRSVGHSMHDFFYEGFLDEVAAAGGKDPLELRRALLADNPRLSRLLEEVVTLSGGWTPGPYEDGGVTKARGVAMASPFGSEVATIAEVSLEAGQIEVHRIWVAIDCGTAVNPEAIRGQVASAVALGLSQTLLEEVVYTDGAPEARNFDMYSILPRGRMPKVETVVLESDAPMGGVGEPGLPGVAPAVVNAAAALTGVRVRALPTIRTEFASQG